MSNDVEIKLPSKINKDGRISIPAIMRKALGLSLEQEVVLQLDTAANVILIRPVTP